MLFKYKGEEVMVEFNNGVIVWVYAYNMRMCWGVVPDDLKLEIQYRIDNKIY